LQALTVDLSLGSIPTWDDDGGVAAIIETPRDSRNKLKYNPSLGTFRLSKLLPVGMVFLRLRIPPRDARRGW
jgi:hypothetical protein